MLRGSGVRGSGETCPPGTQYHHGGLDADDVTDYSSDLLWLRRDWASFSSRMPFTIMVCRNRRWGSSIV